MAEDEDANIISEVEKKKANPEKENLDMVIGSSKYAVGGESTEVPATLKENDGSIPRKEQNQSKQKDIKDKIAH
jgi:hypothetical protein